MESEVRNLFSARTNVQLDHKNLNKDVDWINVKIVSLENLLQIIWQKLNSCLLESAPNVELEQLLLWETSRIYAKITK